MARATDGERWAFTALDNQLNWVGHESRPEEAGVASQGPTRQEALENLDEATELTAEARNDDTAAPEPDAPWFDS